MVCHLQLNDRSWTVEIEDGRLQVQSGKPTAPDVSLRTDPETLNALLDDPSKLDAAVSERRAVVTDDWSALLRLLGTVVAQNPSAV
jgi:predicted lipid carrier protein YhbT